MAEENINKQEFVVRNLATRSVTLYPAKAHVIHSIDDITLKPGVNEITIYGLTPTADEGSISVDGKGSATITDMTVELTPNRENYDDIYPESDEDEKSDKADDGDDGSDTEPEIVKTLTRQKRENEDAAKQASEDKASASSRLAMLETYSRSMDKDRPNDLSACISAYTDERKKAFDIHCASEARLASLAKERQTLSKKLSKAMHGTEKKKLKASKERTKKFEKKCRVAKEKLDAKKRIKQERIEFWPRKVYKVVLSLSLDTHSNLTPASSRRGSIDSLAKASSDQSTTSSQISLSLSYITHSCCWIPRYDLSLDTPTSSGQITYRAEFCNATSEVWKDAKVILSTSETSSHGLSEPPTMQPWHIRLNKVTFGTAGDVINEALLSRHEIAFKRQAHAGIFDGTSEPRNSLFGVGNSNVTENPFTKYKGMSGFPMRSQVPQNKQVYQRQAHTQAPNYSSSNAGLFGAKNNNNNINSSGPSSLFAQPAQGGGLFGSSTNNVVPQPAHGGGLFGSSSNNALASNSSPFAMASQTVAADEDTSEAVPEYDDTEETIIPELPSLTSEESEWSEIGMTATYEIPGLRTIAPSHTMRRHKIASLILKDIHLSYIVVPKLRAAAFLKARIRNTSSISLLKGPVGLTLDGSFLGNASLPRCSAGESFSLSLGIDPSVTVTYSKPMVKRSQSGVFQKEGSSVYTRTISVTNTKSNRSIEGLVLDQIPVSEDERLKVDVLQPSGLRSEGDSAKSGAGIATVGKITEKWGTARATLKKAGEVCWNVKLEPSRGVKLVLEYEHRFPSTETIVGC